MADTKCPTCASPAPELHPAMQFEGEVQPCRDGYHQQVTASNTPEKIASVQAMLTADAIARDRDASGKGQPAGGGK